MKPLRVTVRVQNNRLIAGRKALGLNQTDFAKAAQTSLKTVIAYENLHAIPFNLKGDVRPSAVRIAALLCQSVAELWPEIVQRVQQPVVVREFDGAELAHRFARQDAEEAQALLPAPDDEVVKAELKIAIESLLETLSSRQREVLELRFGLCGEREHTQAEIAVMFDVSDGRISEIERNSLQKLRPNRWGYKPEDVARKIDTLREFADET